MLGPMKSYSEYLIRLSPSEIRVKPLLSVALTYNPPDTKYRGSMRLIMGYSLALDLAVASVLRPMGRLL